MNTTLVVFLIIIALGAIVGLAFILNDRTKKSQGRRIEELEAAHERDDQKIKRYEHTLMRIGAGSETAAMDAQDAIGFYNTDKELNR